jgi:hypothetical protein
MVRSGGREKGAPYIISLAHPQHTGIASQRKCLTQSLTLAMKSSLNLIWIGSHLPANNGATE